MQTFFESLGVMDADGKMTAKAGDTAHVYVAYRRRKGDKRTDDEIRAEAKAKLEKLQARGNDLGYGHDGKFGMPPAIKDRLYKTYAEAKRVLYTELGSDFLAKHPDALVIETTATDRKDYVAHPPKGEVLSEKALTDLRAHRKALADKKGAPVVQVIVSDGLNAESITGKDQLEPFLTELNNGLKAKGIEQGRLIILKNGRVRAGYQVGQELHGGEVEDRAATVHVIGERPGNGQNTYSAYIGVAPRARWKTGINHDIVRVVSGVSITSTVPAKAAQQVLEILLDLLSPKQAQPVTP
jgi:ethanolamine ammonia-lyase large subunit